ncbi:MAG: pilus assembly protein [Pseudorhodoplanes sp.]|nr:pilus assembly protein [Pseudorhodoplanes sp.]
MIAAAKRIALSLLPARLTDFARDRRGVSAVEFAIMLPLMLTIYLGTEEVAQGVGAHRKVTLTARAVADLTAQASNLDNAGMNNVLNASAAILAPYPVSKAKITVSLIKIDGNGIAKIEWSDTKNGTARAKGSVVTVPSAFVVNNTSLIWGEVEYAYTPTIGYVISGTMNLKDQIYMRPRLTDTVTRSNS